MRLPPQYPQQARRRGDFDAALWRKCVSEHERAWKVALRQLGRRLASSMPDLSYFFGWSLKKRHMVSLALKAWVG